MALTRTLKSLYRGHAQFYPRLFNAQQRYQAMLESRLGHLHQGDFQALPLLGLPADARCLDVGGSRGQSLTGLKRALPGAFVVSFEPNPVTYRTLRQVAARFDDAITYNVGLGAAETEAIMHIPRCAGLVFDQLARIARPDVGETVRALKSFGFAFASPANVTFERRVISVRRLDDFALSPDFIKIDVEGAELQVLEGAVRTLASARPALLVERGERPEVTAFLSPHGYLRCVYANGALSFAARRPAPTSFFVHESRIPLSVGPFRH